MGNTSNKPKELTADEFIELVDYEVKRVKKEALEFAKIGKPYYYGCVGNGNKEYINCNIKRTDVVVGVIVKLSHENLTSISSMFYTLVTNDEIEKEIRDYTYKMLM